MSPSEPSRPDPHRPDLPGINGLERIGRGGFARVYRGWQVEMHRMVAVKVLDGTVDDPDAERQFRREVAAMGAASHHPNVVSVYVTGVTGDGHPYFIMPYLPGGSLTDRLARGPLAAEEVSRIGVRTADALAAAHETGVLHRDVKPSNILFSVYGDPQLADFGIARLADATRTNSGLVAATVAYAAPEILSGQHAGPESDVYSLGASLHAALRGAPPFSVPAGEPVAATVGRVATQPPPDLREAGVPDPLAGVIERAMAKEPGHRPATAEAFRDELAAAAEAVPEPAPEPTLVFAPEAAPESPESPAPAPGVPGTEKPALVSGPPAGAELEPPPAGPPRQRRVPVMAAAVLVAAAVVLGLLALLRAGGNAEETAPAPTDAAPGTEAPAAPATTPLTESPATTDAPLPAPTASAAPDTTAAAPVTTDAPPPTNPRATTTAPTTEPEPDDPGPATDSPGAATVPATLNGYYRLLSDDSSLANTWRWLTPSYQSRVGGFGAYQAFWEDVESVSISGVDAATDDGATATLRFVFTDGAVSVERVEFRFARQPDGNLLIDGYQPVG